MADLVARQVRKGQGDAAPFARLALGYEARLLRRKTYTLEAGQTLLVDLARATSLDDGDALETEDGALIVVAALSEPVMRVTGPDLARYAWHIGNRHAPCEVGEAALFLLPDPVLEAMLGQLGAEVEHITRPFNPEGGAYGHGRTMGHSHGD